MQQSTYHLSDSTTQKSCGERGGEGERGKKRGGEERGKKRGGDERGKRGGEEKGKKRGGVGSMSYSLAAMVNYRGLGTVESNTLEQWKITAFIAYFWRHNRIV